MKTQSSKTAAVMNLISRGGTPVPVNEGQVPAVPGERSIPELVEYIGQQLYVGGMSAINAGNGLIEAKQKLKHGEWGDWLAENFGLSARQAQRLMTLAREYGDSNATLVSDLGPTKALALLALPESERDAFVSESHSVDGEEKTVIDMSAREFKKAIREKAEALADKAAAEQARDKMAEDMKIVKQLLETAQKDRDTSRKEAQERQELLRTSELEVSRLAQELDDLKKRPVEVAVQVDQDALVKAREEGRAKAKAEFKTARKAAQEQVMKANAVAAQTKTELDKALREIEDLKFESDRKLQAAQVKLDAALKGQTPSPIAGDAVLLRCHVLFDQAQQIAKQIRELLIEVRKREDGATAEKLENALRALGNEIGGMAQ